MINRENILITGGGGFIGSHIAQRLSDKTRVTVLDDFSTGEQMNVSFLSSDRIVSGDIRNSALLNKLVEDQDILIHMAAMMGVRRTLENPLEVLQVNIEGTREVLKAARAANVSRIVFASTSEVYGNAAELPYAEGDYTSPETNYAVSKLAAERFVRANSINTDMDYTILRYFNVYGPRQDSSEYGYVIPIFINRALENKPLIIHGSGQQTRDFTYIDDAVECSVKSLSEEGANQIFNVGTGCETSIRSLANLVSQTVSEVPVKYVEHPRPYSINRRCADITKSKQLLEYEPSINVKEGINKMINSIS